MTAASNFVVLKARSKSIAAASAFIAKESPAKKIPSSKRTASAMAPFLTCRIFSTASKAAKNPMLPSKPASLPLAPDKSPISHTNAPAKSPGHPNLDPRREKSPHPFSGVQTRLGVLASGLWRYRGTELGSCFPCECRQFLHCSRSGRSARSMNSPDPVMHALEITFSRSRTFPGQGCSSIAVCARRVSPEIEFRVPKWSASRSSFPITASHGCKLKPLHSEQGVRQHFMDRRIDVTKQNNRRQQSQCPKVSAAQPIQIAARR